MFSKESLMQQIFRLAWIFRRSAGEKMSQDGGGEFISVP